MLIPIVFWTLGAITILAAVAAVIAKRPARAVQSLVVVMGATAAMVFTLKASLLGTEMLITIVGALVLVWTLVVRPGRMRLGPPGRARLSITRLVAFFVSMWTGSILLWSLGNSPNLDPATGGPWIGGSFGLWMTGVVILTAAATLWVVVAARSEDNAQGEGP